MKKLLFIAKFQSPRSGKFVSDYYQVLVVNHLLLKSRFNPLDRGNLYQIWLKLLINI